MRVSAHHSGSALLLYRVADDISIFHSNHLRQCKSAAVKFAYTAPRFSKDMSSSGLPPSLLRKEGVQADEMNSKRRTLLRRGKRIGSLQALRGSASYISYIYHRNLRFLKEFAPCVRPVSLHRRQQYHSIHNRYGMRTV